MDFYMSLVGLQYTDKVYGCCPNPGIIHTEFPYCWPSIYSSTTRLAQYICMWVTIPILIDLLSK